MKEKQDFYDVHFVEYNTPNAGIVHLPADTKGQAINFAAPMYLLKQEIMQRDISKISFKDIKAYKI